MTEANLLIDEMVETILNYHTKGWSPATSTNYSFKFDGLIYVSKSGIDKSKFSKDSFMTIDENGNATEDYYAFKPSAETLIHTVLYKMFKDVKVILHSHSIYSVLNSQKYQDFIHFNGYEIQKGFDGQTTHENTVSIPIFENSQNMNLFSTELQKNQKNINQPCFIIKNHGSYAWGKNLFEAKRHLETLEYLLELNWKLNH